MVNNQNQLEECFHEFHFLDINLKSFLIQEIQEKIISEGVSGIHPSLSLFAARALIIKHYYFHSFSLQRLLIISFLVFQIINH